MMHAWVVRPDMNPTGKNVKCRVCELNRDENGHFRIPSGHIFEKLPEDSCPGPSMFVSYSWWYEQNTKAHRLLRDGGSV